MYLYYRERAAPLCKVISTETSMATILKDFLQRHCWRFETSADWAGKEWLLDGWYKCTQYHPDCN